MSAGSSFFHSSSCYFCLLLFMALFHSCLCNINSNAVLCTDDERQALFQFKHGLVDEANRLASWVGEKSECCKWPGIVCDNITGHVQKIHLPGYCLIDYYYREIENEELIKLRLRGNLSPSLLHLKQLKHLDLSCNDFSGLQIPSFIGSLGNLRYLNLSRSGFKGLIPPQLGNLSELHTLCLGSFSRVYYNLALEGTSMKNMHWLSKLRRLHILDMNGVDLSNATDWLQVINTLPSLVQLHLSGCQVSNIHPHVPSLNLTSLLWLDLSSNDFKNSLVSHWIFNIASLVSLDLSWCNLHSPVPSGGDSFRNLTSLEFLHVPENNFMSSSLVLKGLSSVASNLISLDISYCGVSSSALNSLHNLTSLLSLNMLGNQLTKTIPKSWGHLCNLKYINLAFNNFENTSLTSILESFLECKSPCLEWVSFESSSLTSPLPNQLGQLRHLVVLELSDNDIVGTIPDSIGQLSFLKDIDLAENLISGPIPFSIGGLSSLEGLSLSKNRLNGSIPESLGLLSKLKMLDLSHNMLTGVVMEAHFANLKDLKSFFGIGNNLTLRPRVANWIPSFQLQQLSLSSWDLGPQFPLWLLHQRDLVELDISNTRISSTMPPSFWRSLPKLRYLDMSHNNIQGRLFDIPVMLLVLYLSSNKFSGQLPQLSNSSSTVILDLSNNLFEGSLHHLICPYGGKFLEDLNLANNHLSGFISQCWEKYPKLMSLNLENNNLSGGIPRSLGSLSSLTSLNMCNNKLFGRLPTSLKKLTNLSILQLARNKLVGKIPAWLGRELLSLRLLNLRSNNFEGHINDELCHLTAIQILDLAHNNLFGNIPRCFYNYTPLSGKEITLSDREFTITSYDDLHVLASASLVIKGREDTYNTILGLVMALDLSSNNFHGAIPRELMTLQALQSLNLSRNQLTGNIPQEIGDMKSLVSFDVSLNQLSGELPTSLSSLNFLSSFNVSYNSLTGRVPTSTQLQSFNESCFFGNNLCGAPLTRSCVVAVPDDADHKEEDGLHGAEWGLIISMVSGFIAGLWVVVAPLIISSRWRIAYFSFLRELKYKICDVIHKYRFIMFHK